jgi:hypothetical protein
VANVGFIGVGWENMREAGNEETSESAAAENEERTVGSIYTLFNPFMAMLILRLSMFGIFGSGR